MASPIPDSAADRPDSRPSWFEPSVFLSPDFNSESYIRELSKIAPMDNLVSVLQSHLSSLHHDIIKREYTDFSSVDASVEYRDKIQAIRATVSALLVSLRNCLTQRSEAAAASEVLEILLNTHHVVSNVGDHMKELPIEDGTTFRETQSILLERIASEMNRLKSYIAQEQDLPFVQDMEKRIQSASVLLDEKLGHCFAEGLENRDANAIINCLRAYVAIDKAGNAVETFCATVVAPMMQKLIPHGSSGVVVGASGGELENDYEQIKKWIEEYYKFLLESSSFTENSGIHVFDFLANSVLKEVLSAIQKGKPHAFSPESPTQFSKNYKSSLDFLNRLEGYCSSRVAVMKFRTEPVYVEFMKQWDLEEYFSVRLDEIGGALETVLELPNIEPEKFNGNSQGLTLEQSNALLEALRSCWREDVFLVSCSDKFLCLSHQLVSRYSHWLSTGLAARRTGDTNRNAQHEWAISASLDDLVCIVHDIKWLAEYICGDYLKSILQLLSDNSIEGLDLIKQSILQSGKSLRGLLPLVISTISQALVDKSVEDVDYRKLYGMPGMRCMVSPKRPLHVEEILRPLKGFLDGERVLAEDDKKEVFKEVATELGRRYFMWAADLVHMYGRNEISAFLRTRKGAMPKGATTLGLDFKSCQTRTVKLCKLLSFNIQEYGRHLADSGVEASTISEFTDVMGHCVRVLERPCVGSS